MDVNQQVQDPSGWNDLTETIGPLPFAAGTSASVVLSDDANGYVIADGIKLKLQP